MGLFDQQFGEAWEDERLKDVPRGGTPVGKACRVCGEAIRAGDQGVQIYSTPQTGPSGTRELTPIHREHIDRFLSGEG